MKPNQRLKDSNGYEVMLFPLEYMNISQGEYGSLSHELAMDFLGWDNNGRVYECPYYAPCSCRCVAHWGSSDNATWQSINPVHCADGVIRIVTFNFNHDASPPAVGTILRQGDLIGHTGTAGIATGDHMHFNTANGSYDGYEQISGTPYYELKNSNHIYDICYINNTTVVDGNNYDWLTFSGGIVPQDGKRKNFKWAIYARKLRNRRQ